MAKKEKPMLLDFLERGLRGAEANVEEWQPRVLKDPIDALRWAPLRQMVRREALASLLKAYRAKGPVVVVEVAQREARRRAMASGKPSDLIWWAIQAEEISVWADLACDIEAIAAEDEETA